MIIAAAPLLPEALPRGVPPTQIDVSSAKDALMRAVVTCDEDAALAAIAAGAGFGRKERETGYTALHHACQFGLQRLVEVLLDEGADLTAKTRDLILQGAVIQPGGQTALHLAAMHGEAAIVDLLLARGADVDSEDFDGLTPAVTAAVQKRRAIADRLAAVAGTTLPSAEALETISNCSREAGRVRAAGQLSVPPHLRQVYTLERVWSIEECERVLAEVQAAAAEAATRTAIAGTLGLSNGWTTQRHTAYATTDMPCSSVPAVDNWVRASLRERVFPELAVRHGWLPRRTDTSFSKTDVQSESVGSRLTFRDLFFVRYSAAVGGQAGLALHRDGSILSFNILLNSPSSFEGGGTYIEADDRVYQIDQGDCFVHSGKLRHSGNPISRGERHVLVAFIDVLDDGEVLEAE